MLKARVNMKQKIQILFLLYINDLPNAIDIFSSLFADDKIFARSDSNLNMLEARVNMELEKSKFWFQANKCCKAKFMVFRTKTNGLCSRFIEY